MEPQTRRGWRLAVEWPEDWGRDRTGASPPFRARIPDPIPARKVALQRTPATARARLDTLVWADAALYHAWRLAESLRIASGK